MRLMDAEKAKEVLRGLLYETAMNNIRYANVYEDLAKNRMDIWFNLIPTIEAVPTEFHDKCQQIEIEKRLKLEAELKEVEPIRHGHWEDRTEDEDGIYEFCSVCHIDVDITHYGKSYAYCPHCGARMDTNDTYSTGHNERDTEVTE